MYFGNQTESDSLRCIGVTSAFDASISGDVKGTITDAVRYRFVSNDIRRHRVISISYTSLLPCHRLPAQTKSAVRYFGVALLSPLDDFLDGIGRMMIHRLRKLAVRITIRDQGCDVISPSQMSLRQIIHGHLKVATCRVNTA